MLFYGSGLVTEVARYGEVVSAAVRGLFAFHCLLVIHLLLETDTSRHCMLDIFSRFAYCDDP